MRKPTCQYLDKPPTFEEFNKIIKSAKSHKTGRDILSVEILKYAPSKMLKLSVYQIILRIWEDLQIPDSFLEHILCSIYKKGDKSLCENQRGISLMSHVCKIFSLLLEKHLEKYFESIGIFPESQCAFRRNRSTVDMMFTARLLQQACLEKQITLFLAFLDITKAHDSVGRQTLWKILEALGLPH